MRAPSLGVSVPEDGVEGVEAIPRISFIDVEERDAICFDAIKRAR